MSKCDENVFCKGFEKISNSSDDKIGLGIMELVDLKLKTTTRLPIYRYGKNKKEFFAINYCPICGGDFKVKERLNQ